MSTFKIKVRSLDNSEIELQLPVNKLKEMITTKKNIPVEQQRVIFQGKVLQNDTLLSDYSIKPDDVLHLVSMPRPNTQPPTEQPTTPVQPQIGPGMMMGVSIGQEGGLDLNNILSGVLNSFGFGGRQQQQQQQQPQTQQPRQENQSDQTTGSTSSTSSNSQPSLNDLITTLQNTTTSLQNLSQLDTLRNLLGQNNLTNENREQIYQLLYRLGPEVQRARDLLTQLDPLLQGLTFGPNNQVNIRPRHTSNVVIHLHTSVNDLNSLPGQLERVRGMVNIHEGIQVRPGTSNQPSSTQAPNVNFGQLFGSVLGVIGNQNNQTAPLQNIISSLSQQFGIPNDDDSDSVMGQFLNLVMSDVNLTEIMGIMNGNWTGLERIKGKFNKHVLKLLKDDTSQESRNRLIETWVYAVKEGLTENSSFMELAKKSKTNLVDDICEISRYHFDQFVKFNLDMKCDYPCSNTECPTKFACGLQNFFTVFVGDAFSEIKAHLGDDEAKRAFKILLESYVQQTVSGTGGIVLPPGFGSNALMNLVEKFLSRYKDKFSNKSVSKLKATQVKIEVKTEKKSDDKVVDDVMDFDDMLEDSFNEIKHEKKEETPIQVKKEKVEEKKEPWMKNLTDAEIEDVENKLKSVDDEIYSDDEFSPAYKSGGSDGKKHNKKKKPNPPSDHVEID